VQSINRAGDTILNFAERKASLQRIVEKLEGLVQEDASLLALDSEQRKVDSFEEYLDSLDATVTVDEVTTLEEAFETEHSIILHAGNVAFNVHRHERIAPPLADDGRSPAAWPAGPLEPRSAVAPETVDLARLS
jgi:exonuclease VII small subunit